MNEQAALIRDMRQRINDLETREYLGVSGNATLTNGYVLFGGSNGTIAQDSDLQFDGTSLFINSIRVNGGTLSISNLGATAATTLEIGNAATGNRQAAIDLHGDDTYTDYSARFVRDNTGANANTSIIHRGTGSLILYGLDAGKFAIMTNNAERLRIGSDGKIAIGSFDSTLTLGIGDTDTGFSWISDGLVRAYANNTTVYSWSNAAFDIHQPVTIGTFGVSGTSSAYRLYVVGATTTAGNYAAVFRKSDLNNLMYLENNGTAWVNQAWTVGSGRSTKKNIENVEADAKTKLRRLGKKVRKYNLKNAEGKHYGLIADEVAVEFPELSVKSVMKSTDAEGNETDEVIEGVRYGDLVPLLLMQVSDLADEIDELKKKK